MTVFTLWEIAGNAKKKGGEHRDDGVLSER